MNLIYADDSKDEKLSVFSALSIPENSWQQCFDIVRDYRRKLKSSDGIYVYKELHAWKFISGRGNISDHVVSKFRRCEIFINTLKLIATLPGVQLFNTAFPPKSDEIAFERLLNRINKTVEVAGTNALIICDQGKEAAYTRLRRRISRYNPIPSQFGVWLDTGETHKNIPIRNIIEDPFFKDSKNSYFIQLVDFCAYALLRRESPIDSKSMYGIDSAFNHLDPVLMKEASKKDPEGIIRP
jgi:hypothetical protein